MTGKTLTVDIGTSSLKAAFIDLNGRLLAFSRSAYWPDSADALLAEDWERAFALTLENLFAQAPDCGIDGVCISGNGPTLVPLNRDGQALPPLYWFNKNLPRTTFPASPSFFLPHIAWLKENSPAEYEKTRLFVSSHEWLAFRLGAEALTVLPQAAYEPYYWDDEQCRLIGLDREKFPPFVKMGSVMGNVSTKAASSFGLKSGTPIIAGGPDFITALIGTGTFRPGDVCDRAGSSEGINLCSASPLAGKDLRVLPHVKEGLWNIGSLIPSSGRLFEQYRRDTNQEGRPYEELLAELIPHSPLPTPYSLLPTPHSPLESGRAVLCAMGFAVRAAIEKLEGARNPGMSGASFQVKEMRVSGGQARNARWNQLKADISGVSLMIPEICDGELAGNAVLAAVALGEASNMEEAAGRMIRIRKVFKPTLQLRNFGKRGMGNIRHD